ncbi:hypothetical protein A5639_24455 [Mycolicibacterium conceptionense]|nr:hypothetical protein A5639_24455 [Mycolicibacterium conceptionense]
MASWLDSFRAWVHERTRPTGESGMFEQPPTDAEVIAAWTSTTEVRPGQRRVNPLLDLPLAPFAGMNKSRLWEMFVWRLADSEATWILHSEESWGPPTRSTMNFGVMEPLTDAERTRATPR